MERMTITIKDPQGNDDVVAFNMYGVECVTDRNYLCVYDGDDGIYGTGLSETQARHGMLAGYRKKYHSK